MSNKKMNKKNNLFQFTKIIGLVLFTVCLQKSNLVFAVTIQNLTVAPLNRLTVKFDKLPENIETNLAANKRELSINLKNASFSDTQNSLTSEGIIRQVDLLQKENETFLTLTLAEQRGYTVAKSPFSQLLIIDIFDWNKLNSGEEFYREGLLSLIDGINELAKPNLQNAVKENIGDAAAFLGFIYLSEGKINSALKSFRFAEINNTTVNDVFAALSQIYKTKNDNEKSERYAKIFRQKTNEKQVPTIEFPTVVEQNDNVSEKLLHIDSVLNANENFSENLIDEDDENSENDSTQINLDANKSESQSIWSAENYLLTKYAVGIGIALILGIVYLYLKWRNKQLLILQAKQAEENKKTKKQTNPTTVGTGSARPAKGQTNPAPTKKSENFGDLVENKMAEMKFAKNNSTVKTSTVNNSKVGNSKETVNKKRITDEVDIKKNADSLLSLIDSMKASDVIKSNTVLKSELTSANLKAGASAYKTFSQQTVNENFSHSNKNIPKKHSANIELANRLANEQKKIKEEKLSGLGNTLEIETSKLLDVAQKLGIEKNTIETKQNLENLVSKEEEFAKLSEKFGVKHKNS